MNGIAYGDSDRDFRQNDVTDVLIEKTVKSVATRLQGQDRRFSPFQVE